MTAARLLASFGGVGLLRPAPGTWGSLAAAVLGAGILAAGGPVLLLAGIALAVAGGFWAIPRAGGEADPGWVVIDEVAGTWIAMLPIAPLAPVPVMAALLLFRLFDIAKPGPIGALDRMPGATGVMCDDLAAGAAAAGCLWLLQRYAL